MSWRTAASRSRCAWASLERLLPAGFGRFGRGGPVLVRGQGGDLGARDAAGWDGHPHGEMQDEVPDCVGAGYGALCGGLVGYAGQDFAERGAVPGGSFVGAVELVEDAGDFCHGVGGLS